MSRYRILESVKHGVERVHSYEDLEIHHPSRNAKGLLTGNPEHFERGRVHKKVAGEFEEVRVLPDGRELVKKDFVLAHDGKGPVRIPAPVDGFVHYMKGDATAPVRIYDRPFNEPGAKLLAQVLHMDRKSFLLKEGAQVRYGQALGVMSDTGTPGAVHAHVEAEIGQFRKYIRDIDNGSITPETYPGKAQSHDVAGHANTVSRPDQAPRNLRAGDIGSDVRHLQMTLSNLGYRGEGGNSIAVDGDFGGQTERAVKAFQQAHGLHVDGVVGDETRETLAKASRMPLVSERTHPDNSLFQEAKNGLRHLPLGTFRNEADMDRAAGTLVSTAKHQGLIHIDHVMMNTRGDGFIGVQGNPQDPARHVVSVDKANAVSQSLVQSTAQLADHGAARQQATQVHVQAEHMEYRAGLSIGMRP